MKKMYSKMFLKRFVIYPAIIGYLTLHVFDWMVVSEFGKLFHEAGPLAILEGMLNITIPFEDIKMYYAYAIGFSYGTMSVVLPVHKLKLGVIGLMLMYLKYCLSIFVIAPFAMALIPVELLIVGTLFVIKKISKKPINRMSRQQPVHA